MTRTTTLGREFAEALARKDFDRIAAILHPEVDFRGLTPSRAWQAAGPESVIKDVLRMWFEDTDEIERVVSVQADSFADRERVGYRFEGRHPFVLE